MMTRPSPMAQALKNKKAQGFDITISILPNDDVAENGDAVDAMGGVDSEKEEKELGLAPKATVLGEEADAKDVMQGKDSHNPDLSTEEWMQKDSPMDKEAFKTNLMKGGMGKLGMLKK